MYHVDNVCVCVCMCVFYTLTNTQGRREGEGTALPRACVGAPVKRYNTIFFLIVLFSYIARGLERLFAPGPVLPLGEPAHTQIYTNTQIGNPCIVARTDYKLSYLPQSRNRLLF
jgi:hypothetical protein